MNRKRILIFRPDNIGDVVLFSGALRQIRELYPHACLTLAVQAHILNLVELCPYVDCCVPVNRLLWFDRIADARIPCAHRLERLIRGANRIWNELFAPYDLVIYPVKSPSVRHLRVIHGLNVKETIGMVGCRLNVPSASYPVGLGPSELFTERCDVSSCDPWRHELLTTLDFLRFLGGQAFCPDDIKPEFWLSADEIDRLFETKAAGSKIIGLLPGATSELRCWDPCNFGDFARLMGKGCCYAIFGSREDKDLVDRVVSSIGEAVEGAMIINLVGKTTLREFVKSISSCDIFIGMETSGLHMAVAQGVPTIGIIGGGHYGRFVPWGDERKNVFLTEKLGCFHCNWICTRERAVCIQAVTPRDVADAAAKLLNG